MTRGSSALGKLHANLLSKVFGDGWTSRKIQMHLIQLMYIRYGQDSISVHAVTDNMRLSYPIGTIYLCRRLPSSVMGKICDLYNGENNQKCSMTNCFQIWPNY